MYKLIQPYFQHKDPRGSITGLLNSGEWCEVNLITSDAGTTRGRHYHKDTLECFLVLSGRIRVTFRKPGEPGTWSIDERIFTTGEVFVVETGVEHTFDILEASQWINLLSQAVDPFNADFHRYAEG